MRRRRLPLLAALALALATPATASAVLLPSDGLFDQQWAMLPDGPLDGPGAWRYGIGDGQVVAVLDTGVDQTHPDLRDALWTNPGEIPGNGRDDDRDGFVDDVHGADLVNKDGDPADDAGHGTHVAGIIAARRNGRGTVGLAPGARIMAVKVLDDKAHGTTDLVAAGVRYAVAHGADVINTSINADADDTDLDAALREADAAGITVVASAGNNGRNLDRTPSYPASSDAPNVVSVAATQPGDLIADFSNFGSRSVDLAAPGTSIASTALGGGYEERSGTSMSAPEVTATVALVRAAAPSLAPAAIRDVILRTAVKHNGILDLLRTGEVDPVAALRAAGAVAVSDDVAARLRARVRRRSGRRTLITWSVTGATPSSFRVSAAGGRTLAVLKGAKRGIWVRRLNGRLRVTMRDAAGRALAAATVTL